MQCAVPSRARILGLLAIVAAGWMPAAATAQASWELTNRATATFQPADPVPPVQLESNTTSAAVRFTKPDVEFYTSSSFLRQAHAADTGEPLWLQADAKACGTNSATIQTVQIKVTSLTSLDSESYTAVETGIATGTFRVADSVTTRRVSGPVNPGDGVLELWGEDELQATIDGCGSGVDVDNLLIDPVGVVFDSQTGAPVAGATVRLIDVTGAGNGGMAGGLAAVFAFDETTPAPNTLVTGADGSFQFPLVRPSDYRLAVTPPGDYTFPSLYSPAQLQGAHTIHVTGSYGGNFPVNIDTGTVMLDVPLDGSTAGLFLQKKASRATAEIADSIQYTLTMRNQSGIELAALTVTDDLPAGFSYVANSARVDSVAIADPQGGKGPKLLFSVDRLKPGVDRTLTYRVMVGSGALQGDGVNRAIFSSELPARKLSNVASAAVQLQGGVFDSRAYVLGRIFADCNSNSLLDEGERGIPAVRLYMEDGSFVVSDSEGKYSFYGVSPRTHVLKVDATTLPPGATLEAISHRHGKNGNTQFVDVQKSELHRADFAIDGCNAALMQNISARRAVDTALGRELLLGVKQELKPATQASVGDVRGLPASGIVGETGVAPVNFVTNKPAAGGSTEAPETFSLQKLLPSLTNKADFIGLRDGDEVGMDQIAIRVKGMANASLELRVNDVAIGSDRIGTRIVDASRKIEALEYVGVDLQPGDNQLRLIQRDPFGNIRDIRDIRLVAPDTFAKVVIRTATDPIPADGIQVAKVTVELQDAHGVIVAARTAVTLESSLGEWQVADLDPREPATQVFIEGGQGEFSLRSPLTAGTAKVRATSGTASADATISFVPALRSLVGAGVIEGTLNLRNLNPGALKPARHDDGFEQELQQFSSDHDKLTGGARAALFLKGKVSGEYLLTLGYDSDKDTHERLFRDIQPDQFYPVYGDSSIKGYDAQSTSKLYVRIDKDKSYLLAGDFTTQALSQERKLGAYNRSLTGINEHFEHGPVAVNVFASHDSASQIIEEQPANGTSGPFFLGNPNALENSEQIEILTRDRDQPSLIIRTVPMQRFSDYEIESLTGRILFRAPIPSLDADLNPQSIRITYEADSGGEKFWTTGVDTQVKFNEHFEMGAAVADDRDPVDPNRIISTNATVRFSEITTLTGELAQTQSDLRDSGNAERVDFRHEGAELQVRAFAGRTDADFHNPASILSANRSEAGAKVSYSITERARLLGEALHSGDVTTDSTRNGALIGVERSFAHSVKAELGVRHVVDDAPSQPTTTTTSVRAKVGAPLPFLEKATVFGEYEQDIEVSDARVVAAGGEYRFANRSKLYARHEFISSLTSPYALDPTQQRNATVFGIDTDYLHDDHVFSEYRIRDSLSGREAQAAIGLRNGWRVADGVRLNTSLERIDALNGDSSQETSAVTGAIEYTRNPLWKGTARLELSDAAGSDGLLSTLGLAYKLSEDWTFLGKNAFALTDNSGIQPDRQQERLQLGIAYRDGATNRVNALGRYEFKREEGVEIGVTHIAHILSAHADYQSSAVMVWRMQYAAKFAQDTTIDGRTEGRAHLLAARVTRDISSRWDAGIHVRGLFNGNFGGGQGGLGTEVGYLVMDQLWVSIGYNVLGFRDRDLTAEEYTNRGGYLRLRFKFDESLLGGL